MTSDPRTRLASPTLSPESDRHLLDYDQYVTGLGREIERMVTLTQGADLTSPVPTCPGWNVAMLVEHVGRLYRLASEAVRTGLRPGSSGRDAAAEALAAGGHAAWLRAKGDALLTTLRKAAPDAPAWTFAGDGLAAFWARRMVHETTIHRVDLELACGEQPVVDTRIAVDGIDELLALLAATRPSGRIDLSGDGETLHWHGTDTAPADNAEWLITLEPDSIRWTHAHAPGLSGVRAPAATLYLFAWHRVPLNDQAISWYGDRALLDYWSRHSRL